MRILITNTGPWGTGSFTMAKAVIEEFLKLGHEVRIFFPDSGLPSKECSYFQSQSDVYKIWPFPLKQGSRSIDYFPLMIPDPHPRNPKRNTFSELTDDELSLYLTEFEKEISRLIDDFKPDIVECQHIWAMDHIIEKMGLPYVCTAHYSDQLGFRFDERMRPMAIQSARNAKAIISVSNYVKKEVEELYGVESEKVHVLTNGYDRSLFIPKKQDRESVLNALNLTLPQDAFLISFAGKLSRTKGVDLILKANKWIDEKLNIHFLICGAGDLKDVVRGDEWSDINKERVHFLGHQTPERLAQIHNISNVSLMPSRSEGFGISCLEAMACGCPVIFTDTGGLKEFAVGESVEHENPHHLAEVIQKVRALPQKRLDELSRKAIDKALEFSWEEIAKKRVALYEDILAGDKL